MMSKCTSKLTILFEEPFWIGLYEREDGGRYEVCKIIFGAEPKDCEVYEYVLRKWNTLRFSPGLKTEQTKERRINPKRMQRQIKKQVQENGIGTKAQQALKLMQEEGKAARKALSREQREKEQQRQYELHRQKRKDKHRGH